MIPELSPAVMTTTYSPASIEKIRILAFEYLIAKATAWYCENTNISIQDFNQKNNITARQVMLLPFFACSANGSFNEMFDLFKEFYAVKDGPISESILKAAQENSLIFFEANIKLPNTTIKLKSNNYSTWQDLFEAILSSKAKGVDEEEYEFRLFYFPGNPEKFIYKSINNSIQAIRKDTHDEFITFTTTQMSFIARQYRSWIIPYEYYYNKEVDKRKKSDLLIDKDLASKDRKIYTPIPGE